LASTAHHVRLNLGNDAIGTLVGNTTLGVALKMADASPSILESLEDVIADRKANPPSERSYVVSLLQGGVSKIRSKVVEEAAEVFEAANEPGDGGREHLVKEVADLVFHTLVLLGEREVRWSEVEVELARRFGISGIVEKASRPKQGTNEEPQE
jgi:phosphoribosyl-ATP pyrophosphohydrolase